MGEGSGIAFDYPLHFVSISEAFFAAILEDPELQLNFEYSSSSIGRGSSLLCVDWTPGLNLVRERVTGLPFLGSISLYCRY